MAKHIDYLTYDGKIYAVFTYRTEQTVLGTAWRFIMDDRKTLVLVPFQTPRNLPAHPGMVPGDIRSALSALTGLAFAVHGVYMPQAGTKAYDDVPFSEWGKYAVDKLAKQDKAAEKAAFELIQDRNAKWNGKRMSVPKLRELRDVLFDVANRHENDTHCSHDSLTYALTMWKEITAHDPAESIVLAYGDKMPSVIDEVSRQTANAEGMSAEKARRLVMERISYVADLGAVTSDGHHHAVWVLLQDARCAVHNKEDEEAFRRVAPTEAEREAITVAKEHLRLKCLLLRTTPPDGLETGVLLEYDLVNIEETEWRKAGPNMIRRKDLAECLRMTPADSGFREYLGSYHERRFYPVKKIMAVRAAHERNARLPCEALYDVTQWIPTWKPAGAPNWKHPGGRSQSKNVDQG